MSPTDFPEAEASTRRGAGTATLDRWLQLKRTRGDLSPAAVKGRPKKKVDAAGLELVRSLLEATPDLTTDKLLEAYNAQAAVPVSRATVGRAARAIGWTLKKKPSALRRSTKPASRSPEPSTTPG